MNNLICRLKGHSFKLEQNEHLHLKEYTCTHCKKKFTEDGYGRKVTLTNYWKENNNLFKSYLERTYS